MATEEVATAEVPLHLSVSQQQVAEKTKNTYKKGWKSKHLNDSEIEMPTTKLLKIHFLITNVGNLEEIGYRKNMFPNCFGLL